MCVLTCCLSFVCAFATLDLCRTSRTAAAAISLPLICVGVCYRLLLLLVAGPDA
ncbi:hypothetical protein BJX99DRAFT_228577 [Aspergillus californicus]